MNKSDEQFKPLFTALDEHERLTSNEFKRIVCIEMKAMSDRPFRERRNFMVEKNWIFKTPEVGTSRVWYSRNPDSLKKDSLFQNIDQSVRYLESSISVFQQGFTSYSLDEQKIVPAALLKLASVVETKLWLFRKLAIKDPRRAKLYNRMETCKEKIFALFFTGSPDYKDVSLENSFLALLEDEYTVEATIKDVVWRV